MDAFEDLGVLYPSEVVAAARDMYEQPHRHYHRWSHVEDLLRTKDAIIPRVDLSPEAVAALVLHDVVYDPRSTDNEKMSARWAEHALHGVTAERLARVTRMILATMAHEGDGTEDADTLYVLDLDMSILGAAPAIFDVYDDAIRREYAHVDDATFVVGRGAFLRGLLARPAIFLTGRFHDRLETRARENISRVLEARYGHV